MKRFIVGAIVGTVMAICAPEAMAQNQWDRRPWETDFEWMDRLGRGRRQAIDQLNRDLAAIRNRPPRRVAPSPHLPDLFGNWSVHSRDASGTNWVGRVVFGSNFRLDATFRGSSPMGAVSHQNFTAGFTYAANGNILILVDRTNEIQVNRITWIDRNRFIVTPQSGSQLTYDRIR